MLHRSLTAPGAHCEWDRIEEDRKFREFRGICEEHEIPWTPCLFWLANLDPVKQIKLFKKLSGHWDIIKGKEVWKFDGKFGAWKK